ncbi:serine hydrolase domain-containing protein [Bacillus mycoides]|uniref:serine hydrolase domain-containing protein n=1 Tax=Bacillus mycoides TaxID=1405 RepID=UPI003D197D47
MKTKIEHFRNYMKELTTSNKLVGVSVAVTKGEDILYSEGFGYANIKEKKPITPNTLVSIQSISKSFISLTILQLVEEGKIHLEHPVVTYLPYFQTKDKNMSDTITVKQLLTHTAGFSLEMGVANSLAPNKEEYKKFHEFHKGIFQGKEEISKKISSREDLTKYFAATNLEYVPGQEWEYFTDGYAILGDLFEKVSGEKWELYLNREIVQKLRMSRTTTDFQDVIIDSNRAYYYTNKEEKFIQTPFPINSISSPIGFIYSTTNDMAKYLIALLTKKNDLLQSEMSFSYLYSDPFIIQDGIGYGLGWFVLPYKNYELIEHTGGFLGVSACASMIPSEELGVIVLSNYDKTPITEISHKLIDLFLDITID